MVIAKSASGNVVFKFKATNIGELVLVFAGQSEILTHEVATVDVWKALEDLGRSADLSGRFR